MKWSLENILPIILCLVFPILNYITSHEFLESKGVNIDTVLRWTIISVMLYILWHIMYFFNTKVKKYRLPKMILACAVFFTITYNIFTLFPFFINRPVKWMFIYKSFLAILPFSLIQYALRATKKVTKLELEKEQVQTENYRVQLEALRSKVDPHFLFNSLNTLKSMIHSRHPQSEEFVMNLADFYRQNLKYEENTTLPLSEELKVLEAFLFLMKSRNESGVQVQLEIAESVRTKLLPTLSLQLLAENCFKHNAMSSKTPLVIKIYTTSDGYINVSNNINPKIENKEPSGYGLENLKKRYELLGVVDGIIIEQDTESFCVKLKLIAP